MRHGNVLHLIKISYENLLWNIIFNHSLGVWTSVHYNTHASPATALHWLYLSRRGNRHSQWACVLLSQWVLILSDDDNIRQGSTKPFPDSTKLLRTQRMERTSYKRILNSCNRILLHSPHGFHYPHQCISMGSTTPIGSTHADPLHCLFTHICFCEIYFHLFQTLAVLSRGWPVGSYHQDLLRLGHCQA